MNYALKNTQRMEVTLFQKNYDEHEAFDHFLDVLFYREMKYLASDLLDRGLDAQEIQEAVKRAILIGKTAGLEIRRHFTPVYTSFQGSLMKDCKLSRLGYALVMLNARASNPLTANWQLQLLEGFFSSENASFTH